MKASLFAFQQLLIYLTGKQAINQSLVEVSPNLCLMIVYVIQSRTLNFDVCVHRKLLEKALAIKYGIKDS